MRGNLVHNLLSHDKCKFGCLFNKRLDTYILTYDRSTSHTKTNRRICIFIESINAAVRQINDYLKLIIYKIEFGLSLTMVYQERWGGEGLERLAYEIG